MKNSYFSHLTIITVWQKARPVLGCNPDIIRKDEAGALIKFSEYGKDSLFGWEIDHIIPKAKGGSDYLSNLQPLHFLNNRVKSDNLYYTPAVTSKGNTNVMCR